MGVSFHELLCGSCWRMALSIVSYALPHPLSELINIVLVARGVGGEVAGLCQAHAGSAGQQIDDLRVTTGWANDPVCLVVVGSSGRCIIVMTSLVSAAAAQGRW